MDVQDLRPPGNPTRLQRRCGSTRHRTSRSAAPRKQERHKDRGQDVHGELHVQAADRGHCRLGCLQFVASVSQSHWPSSRGQSPTELLEVIAATQWDTASIRQRLTS